MSILQTKRRPLANTLWRFPRGPLEINHADPFSKHLQAFFIVTPTGLRDLVRQVDIPLTALDDIRPNSSGNLALHYAGTGFDVGTLGFTIDAVGRNSYHFSTGFDPKNGAATGAVVLLANASNLYTGFETSSGDIRSNVTTSGAGVSSTISLPADQSNFVVGGVKNVAFDVDAFIAGHGRGAYEYTSGGNSTFQFQDQTYDRLWLNTGANTYSVDHFAFWAMPVLPSDLWPQHKVNQLMRDPTRIVRPYTRRLFIVPASGADITGTGALAAQASSLAATGEITKTGTGALSAQASAVAGTGEITKTGTGALSAQASAVSGTGTVSGAVTGTGALSSADSEIAATGAIEKTGTGALSAAASTLAATGAIEKTGTGALTAGASAIAGVGTREITGTAALAAGVSTLAGVGTVGDQVAGTGALSAQAAALAASGDVTKTGTGSLAAAVSQIAATGVINRTGTGALEAQPSSISGTDSTVPLGAAIGSQSHKRRHKREDIKDVRKASVAALMARRAKEVLEEVQPEDAPPVPAKEIRDEAEKDAARIARISDNLHRQLAIEAWIDATIGEILVKQAKRRRDQQAILLLLH